MSLFSDNYFPHIYIFSVRGEQGVIAYKEGSCFSKKLDTKDAWKSKDNRVRLALM